MQYTLKVPKKKSAFILEVLKHFKYVEVVPLVKEKSASAKPLSAARRVRKPKQETGISDEQKKRNTKKLLKEMRCAIEELNLIKAGKRQARTLDEFLATL